jgi:anti-sigma regulatory factor (Ser/Thr protein kinase)
MSPAVDTNVVLLKLPATAEYLMFTRLVLTGLSRSVEIGPETLSDLKLAVSEACSCFIRARKDGESLTVRYELAEDAVAVEVTAEPASQRPEASGSVDASENDLGLAIIEALTDELDLRQTNDGRVERLFFRKRLEPAGASSHT